MEAQIKYAHERLNILENDLKKHFEDHARFEVSIAENTKLTKTIAENTQELVGLVKGAKGLRSFVLWAAPLVAVVMAVWTWLKMQASG